MQKTIQKNKRADFQGEPVRSFEIDGEAWFVAKDVFVRLGIPWSTRKLEWIPGKWKRKHKIMLAFRDSQQEQKTWLVNEPAFYQIVARSDHPIALEFTRHVAQFIKDLREGKITPEDLDKLRERAEQLCFKFIDIPPVKVRNDKLNKSKGTNSSKHWKDWYQELFGISFEEKINELEARGVPKWLLEYSGQDGLRFFPDTYAKAMAFATISKLHLDGVPEDVIKRVMKSTQNAYDQLGEFYAERRRETPLYKPSQN